MKIGTNRTINMKQHNTLKVVGVVTTGMLIGGFQSAQAITKARPNLVVFLADDCSYYDLGAYGSKDSKTPNIDKFATEGMLFTKGYQAAPMSSPTRHNLYTGLWPVKTGAYPNHTMVNERTNSIVQHLKPVGYRVALIGKSHVLPKSVFSFEYVPLTKSNDINFAAVDSFIASCAKSNIPFCLFVTSNQPHTPWNKGDESQFDPSKISLPPMYVDTKQTREQFCKYLAEVNFMDDEFGKVLDKIDEYKQRENTVVAFLSEQGNSLPFAKWTCYDAGVHSGIIVRWPGKVIPGTVSDAIVEYCDITPTFVDIAQTKPISKMDGKSFLPVLLRKKVKHKQYTFSLQTTRGINNGSEYYGIRSVADRKYRYIINLTPDATFQNEATKGIVFKEWIMLAKTDKKAKEITEKYLHRPAIELYDLQNDPYCLNNLAANTIYSNTIVKMDKVLKKWMRSCGDNGQETEMKALEHMPKKIMKEE